MSDQSVQFLRTLNTLVYGINLTDALKVLDAAKALNVDAADPRVRVLYDVNTPAGLVAFARDNKEVTDFLPAKKIQAIKALRGAANVGLVEAKNAIDTITAEDHPNYNRY